MSMWPSDCGVPMNEEYSLENVQDGDGIGITKRMHVTCLEGFEKQGSGLFTCRTDGVWKRDLKCILSGRCDLESILYLYAWFEIHDIFGVCNIYITWIFHLINWSSKVSLTVINAGSFFCWNILLWIFSIELMFKSCIGYLNT